MALGENMTKKGGVGEREGGRYGHKGSRIVTDQLISASHAKMAAFLKESFMRKSECRIATDQLILAGPGSFFQACQPLLLQAPLQRGHFLLPQPCCSVLAVRAVPLFRTATLKPLTQMAANKFSELEGLMESSFKL